MRADAPARVVYIEVGDGKEDGSVGFTSRPTK
jgi:hypothetical protein